MRTRDDKVNIVLFPDYHLAQANTTTPESMLRLYWYLENLGVDVEMLDCRDCKNDDELLTFLSMQRQNCIWFLTSVTCQADYVNTVSEILKHISLDNVVVLGGRHVMTMSGMKENLFKLHPYVDMFFEGFVWKQETMKEIMMTIGTYCYRVHNKEALFYRTGDTVNPEDIIIPVPYEIMGDKMTSKVGGWLRKASNETARVQNMMASVGCAFRCKFCDNPFKMPVTAPAEAVVTEICRRVERYGVNGIKFDDDDMFQNLNWNDRFLDALERESPDAKYLMMTRCDIHRSGYRKLPQIERFEKLGLRVIGLGVECPDDRVLQNIDKHTTVPMIMDTIKCISHNTDIDLLLYTIYGLPPLDREAVENTKKFIGWCNGKVKNVIMSGYTPLPGTMLYEDETYGKVTMESKPHDWRWRDFYFFGDIDNVKYLPNGVDVKTYLKYKLEIYRCLNDNGFLREETRNDITKAGHRL